MGYSPLQQSVSVLRNAYESFWNLDRIFCVSFTGCTYRTWKQTSMNYDLQENTSHDRGTLPFVFGGYNAEPFRPGYCLILRQDRLVYTASNYDATKVTGSQLQLRRKYFWKWQFIIRLKSLNWYFASCFIVNHLKLLRIQDGFKAGSKFVSLVHALLKRSGWLLLVPQSGFLQISSSFSYSLPKITAVQTSIWPLFISDLLVKSDLIQIQCQKPSGTSCSTSFKNDQTAQGEAFHLARICNC